jgi:hypothetical protein
MRLRYKVKKFLIVFRIAGFIIRPHYHITRHFTQLSPLAILDSQCRWFYSFKIRWVEALVKNVILRIDPYLWLLVIDVWLGCVYCCDWKTLNINHQLSFADHLFLFLLSLLLFLFYLLFI